jgi:hypothetical protein
MIGNRNEDVRVLVDEGVGAGDAIWSQTKRYFSEHSAALCFIAQDHPGIPDVEILDKLLDKNTILITHDCVLHNRACSLGYTSLTLSTRGKITHSPLPGVKLPAKQPPSVLKELQHDYVYDPPILTHKLNRGLSEKGLKNHRRRRRRIRSYFGSAQNITAASVTIGSLMGRKGFISGYVLNLAGSGVKGLRASEGYCIAKKGEATPALCMIHALSVLYYLQLENVRMEAFIIPTDSLSLTQTLAVAENMQQGSPYEECLSQLLAGLHQITLQPCTKGRFHDGMVSKLHQLDTSQTNELNPLDFETLSRHVREPLPDLAVADGIPF